MVYSFSFSISIYFLTLGHLKIDAAFIDYLLTPVRVYRCLRDMPRLRLVDDAIDHPSIPLAGE